MIEQNSITATIQQCFSNIAHGLPHFKHRPQQEKMIMTIAQTFLSAKTEGEENPAPNQGESILVVEGPTGTGKSLAYLLPAIICAKSNDQYLIVSTGTITLQEQLANNDIPLLIKYGKLAINFAIAKGRSRYVCNQRLYLHAGMHAQTEMALSNSGEEETAVWEQKPSQKEIQLVNELAKLLKEGQWSGDRDKLSENIPDNLWNRLTNDRHGCARNGCPYFSECAFFKARDAMLQADVIIVNHDLLLSDLAMGGGVILAKPQETLYCIDEAHHFADKAVKQFAASHKLMGTSAWLEKAHSVVNRAATLLKNYSINNILQYIEALAENLRSLKSVLDSVPSLKKPSQYKPAILRFELGIVPEYFRIFCTNITPLSKSLFTALSSFKEALKKAKTSPENSMQANLFDKNIADIGFFVGRVENLMMVWSLFSFETTQEMPPIAKWITAEKSQQYSEMDYTIHASPVRTAELLSERFWSKAAGAILTSATLRSLGTFDTLLIETGLKYHPQTRCMALDSPFDFQKQAKLIIPPMKSDPSNAVAHTQEVIEWLPKFIPTQGGNGSLVLFSSKKQMLDVADGLKPELREHLLIQGDKSKEALLKKHFARIAANEPSILFGLASFAEGLDLPGNACKCLIIAKLPFAVPDEPVGETLAEWVKQQGGDPFKQVTLPETSIKLTQALGRLIRCETDEGIVVILDTRLEKKFYGAMLKKGLPPFQQVKYQGKSLAELFT